MDTLRLFVDICRLRSLSAAAQRHGITQSAASQRMAQMEKQLGFALLDRSVRPVGLTAAGRAYLVGAQEALAALDGAEAQAKAIANEQRSGATRAGSFQVRGEVRISAIYSAGMDLLAGLTHAFEKAHPGVAISMDYQKPDAVHRAVLEGRADFGIVSYPERSAGLRILPLREERMGLVSPPQPASTAHALAMGAAGGVRAADLTGVAMLGFDLTLPIGRRIERHLKQHGCEAPVFEHRFDNIDSVKSAIFATGLPAILPLRTVARETAQGALRAVPLIPELVRPVAVITPKDGSLLSPAAKAVLEELLKEAPPDGTLKSAA